MKAGEPFGCPDAGSFDEELQRHQSFVFRYRHVPQELVLLLGIARTALRALEAL